MPAPPPQKRAFTLLFNFLQNHRLKLFLVWYHHYFFSSLCVYSNCVPNHPLRGIIYLCVHSRFVKRMSRSRLLLFFFSRSNCFNAVSLSGSLTYCCLLLSSYLLRIIAYHNPPDGTFHHYYECSLTYKINLLNFFLSRQLPAHYAEYSKPQRPCLLTHITKQGYCRRFPWDEAVPSTAKRVLQQ